MAHFVWKCQCGSPLVAWKHQHSGQVDRYIFAVKCRECGRERRRCFWLHSEDAALADSVLKATRREYILKPLQSMVLSIGNYNPHLLYLTRMCQYMFFKGYNGADITRMLRKRVLVNGMTVLELIRDLGRLDFDLEGAPPFCRSRIYGQVGEFGELSRRKQGGIVELCPFCMLICDREGVRCKAIKEDETHFRFVQLGRD